MAGRAFTPGLMFAASLVAYMLLSLGAVWVAVRLTSLQVTGAGRPVAIVTGWVSGSFTLGLALSATLGGAVVAILTSAFLSRTPPRLGLVFDAYPIVLFASMTPLAVIVMALLGSAAGAPPSPASAAVEFEHLARRVQLFSAIPLGLAIGYLCWFLRIRLGAGWGDAALSTLAGVAVSYTTLALVRWLGMSLGLS